MHEVDDELTHADAAISRANSLLIDAAGLREKAAALEVAAEAALKSTGLAAEEIVQRQIDTLYAEADAPNAPRERSAKLAGLATRLLEKSGYH